MAAVLASVQRGTPPNPASADMMKHGKAETQVRLGRRMERDPACGGGPITGSELWTGEQVPGGYVMTIKRVGFFRELRHGGCDDPALRELLGQLAVDHVDEAVRYLVAGQTLVATGSMVDDVLDPTKRAVARLEMATDGEWVWPRDAAYYVREYRVGLPEAFLRVVAARRGIPPVLDRDALLRVEIEYTSDS